MADHAAEAQADYMADVLRDIRSSLVTAGNKLQTPINRLEKRGIDVHDVEDVADTVRADLEDLLEYALEEVRQMDEEAIELVEETLEDDA